MAFLPRRVAGESYERTSSSELLVAPPLMRALVVGAGATGARIARQLASSDDVKSVEVRDPRPDRVQQLVISLGDAATVGQGRRINDDTDIVVVATPPGSQAAVARRAVHAGVPVVTTSDDITETRALLDLDQEARYHGVPLVVGAGFMPGLTCLLARYAASDFDQVDEIHVAKAGTGGPACARQHHRSLSSTALDWRDGRWTRRPGGSGRELCWFPDPVAGRDCYRASLPDALLLVPVFAGVDRVTARMAATRRDRLTAPLPMLRRPHPEGGVGAVRVEVRGRCGTERKVVVLGAVERPAVAAGAMAAAAALHLQHYDNQPGARGVASFADHRRLLRSLAGRGVRAARFEGFATFT